MNSFHTLLSDRMYTSRRKTQKLREVIILETINIKKCLLIVIGCLALAFGIIGIFLPLLPTTPFLLLAVYCFTRSSNRLYNWLIQHKIFGRYIYNYMAYRAIEPKTKLLALVFLWGTTAFSLFLLPNIYIRILLIAVGSGVTFHILSLKVFK